MAGIASALAVTLSNGPACSQELSFLAGAVAALSGAALTGMLSLIRQRRDASDRRREERRIDLRHTIDVGVDALAEAEYQVFLADIRAHHYVSGGDVEPYLAIDRDVNAAIRAVRAAATRLAIRMPDEKILVATFRTAADGLVNHRTLISTAAEAGRWSEAISASREDVERRILDYERAAVRLVAAER